MSALPDVRALLAAVVEALDVPLADRPEDDATRERLLSKRASDVRIIADSVLQGHPLQECAAQLARWTAESPVTFRSWQDRKEGQR